jgi:hypothetical protein
VTPPDPKLKRMQEQGEKLFAPEETGAPPQNDPIEIWGRRIGRGLSVVIALAALWYLWATLGR